MKSFNQLLSEIKMDVPKAMKVFGISEIPSKSDLRQKYKELSKIYHPDRGGSVRMMQELNAAYEFLKSFSGSEKGDSLSSYEAMAEKYRKLADAIKKEFKKNFDPKTYVRYFEKLLDKKYKADIETYPDAKASNPHFAGIKAKFTSEDNESVFELSISANLTEVRHSGSLGADDITVNLHITAFGFHNNRKQKMAQRDWQFTNQKKLFSDPSLVFPEAKLKKIFAGKKGKFTKKDSILFLKNKLNAKIYASRSNYDFKIPINDTLELQGSRMTFRREGIIQLNSIRDNSTKNHEILKVVSLEETEEELEALKKSVESIQREKDLSKAVKKINRELANRN